MTDDQTHGVIELRDITVQYGAFVALADVSLTLPAGATGLVGRNGAGKSTLLKLLLGLLSPAHGHGTVMGVDIRGNGAALRRAVGYMPESDSFIPGFRGVEQVSLAGELCGLSAREATRRAHESLAYVGLGEARYRPVEEYSTGMKQRLKLAVALVHDPRLLLLDEPTVGMDPPGRKRMLDLIADLAQQHDKSLLLCTHLLSDIETTCKTVVMIDSGRVLTSGSLREVLRRENAHYRLRWDGDGAQFLQSLQGAGGVAVVRESVAGRNGDASNEARFLMPPDFDARRFFHLAHEGHVRLRGVELEHEDLAALYHRLLDNQTAKQTVPQTRGGD